MEAIQIKISGGVMNLDSGTYSVEPCTYSTLRTSIYEFVIYGM